MSLLFRGKITLFKFLFFKVKLIRKERKGLDIMFRQVSSSASDIGGGGEWLLIRKRKSLLKNHELQENLEFQDFQAH